MKRLFVFIYLLAALAVTITAFVMLPFSFTTFIIAGVFLINIFLFFDYLVKK